MCATGLANSPDLEPLACVRQQVGGEEMHKCGDDEERDQEDLVSGHHQRFLQDSCSKHDEVVFKQC